MNQEISAESFIHFNQQLSAMVELELPLPEGLRRASSDMADPRLAAAVERISKELEKGNSLSKAVAAQKGELPELYAALLRAGEESGNMAAVLRQAASHSQDMLVLKNRARAAMIYPAFLAAGFGGLLLLFSFFILPRLTILNEAWFGGASLPMATRMLMGISVLFRDHAWGLVIVLAGLVGTAFAKRNSIGSWWNEAQLKAPLWGAFMRSVFLSRFCKTMAVLLGSGVNLPDALSLTGATMGHRGFEEGVDQIRTAVGKGAKFGPSLPKIFFPGSLIWLLGQAEERGSLEKGLKEAGEQYEQRSRRQGAVLGELLEPVIIVALGLLVAFIVVALFLPMFSVSGCL